MIVIQGRQEELEKLYYFVEKRVDHPYSMPWEYGDVFYCRGLKAPLAQMWPMVKNWH